MAIFSRILFLDFDGVLHAYARGTFTKLPQFSRWLVSQPHIGVVISSTWRLQHPIEELREFFPQAIRHQIIGATPDLSRPDGFIVRAASRSDEIGAWLRDNPGVVRWVALDDEAGLFPNGLTNVVLTPSAEGLSEIHLNRIVKLLA